MSARDALHGFLDKWQARWPEWAVGMAFVPDAQRDVAAAWLALREELAEAAWGFSDARPGEAKLAWWTEELAGWAKGARRHPLGIALQQQPAAWGALGDSLSALAAARGVGSIGSAVAAVQPFAAAAADVARALFGGPGEAGAADAEAVSLLAERLLREAGEAEAGDVAAAAAGLLAAWPARKHGPRPIRIHRAYAHRRLQRLAAGKASRPGRFASLFDAWRAARG